MAIQIYTCIQNAKSGVDVAIKKLEKSTNKGKWKKLGHIENKTLPSSSKRIKAFLYTLKQNFDHHFHTL